jgi:N-acetyltransferase 10
MFGAVDYDPALAYSGTPFEDTLAAAGRAIQAGKLRSVGLSNETAVGVMTAAAAAAAHGLPPPAAISNAYSLLARNFDATVAEAAAATRVPLLAYGTLAAGLLTGKYEAPDGGPPAARLNRYAARYAEEGKRYERTEAVRGAVAGYCGVAADAGVPPAALALRWALHRPAVAAAVIGGTCEAHIAAAVEAAGAGPLPAGVVAACDAVHRRWPNPAP